MPKIMLCLLLCLAGVGHGRRVNALKSLEDESGARKSRTDSTKSVFKPLRTDLQRIVRSRSSDWKPQRVPLAPVVMRGDPEDTRDAYEEYIKSRGEAELAAVESGYRSFKGIDQEFDGGDSGGGAVGDGNMDLEDQHNSPTLGALRGGISEAGSAGAAVGRGNVMTMPQFNDKVQGATEARVASAGKNYFGRTTGLAEELIANMKEEDVKNFKMDKVRAQQKENWFNQRAIYEANKAQGQGVVFGEDTSMKPRSGGYIAREAIDSKAYREGAKESEISQRDLAKHMQEMAVQPAERLDGQEWGPLTAAGGDVVGTIEMQGSSFQEIKVANLMNTFAPYRCFFTPDSDREFTVSPNAGTMNRRSGDPINLMIRFRPQEQMLARPKMATLVFETEDFKQVWNLVGST